MRGRSTGAAWLVVASMTSYLLLRRSLEGPIEVAATVAVTAGSVAVAVVTGSTVDELGLAPNRLGAGVRWGVGVGLAAAAVILVVSLVPLGSAFFSDERYEDLTGSELAFEVLVRVPFATALVEELLFRGVLLALFLRRRPPMTAMIVSSVLFGLWHVLPALTFADANEGFGSAGALLAVPITVLATGLAGCALAWLRLRSGSLAGPILVHAAVNAAGVLAVAGR